MHRSLRQKVIGGAAVAVLLAGGALAAVSATGQSNPHKTPAAKLARAARRSGARDLATAASYLGVSPGQLSSELQAGKTLAQVAGATPGKSAQGLIEALVAAKKARVAAATAKLPKRVSAEVNRPGGPGAGALGAPRSTGGGNRVDMMFAGPHHQGSIAASYLGAAPAQLQAELESGKTLAQVAEATAGRSKAGLIAALVAARTQELAGSVAAGRLTQAKEARRQANLSKRVTTLVDRRFAKGAAA
jgi:hypothetical protein